MLLQFRRIQILWSPDIPVYSVSILFRAKLPFSVSTTYYKDYFFMFIFFN